MSIRRTKREEVIKMFGNILSSIFEGLLISFFVYPLLNKLESDMNYFSALSISVLFFLVIRIMYMLMHSYSISTFTSFFVNWFKNAFTNEGKTPDDEVIGIDASKGEKVVEKKSTK